MANDSKTEIPPETLSPKELAKAAAAASAKAAKEAADAAKETNPSGGPLNPHPTAAPQGASRDAEKEAARETLRAQRDELRAMQEELELLEMKNAKQLLQAKIDLLKNGGLHPGAVKRRDIAIAKRDSTAKEEQGDGKVLALYELKEKGYKGLFPGDMHAIREAGTIIRLPVDKLPGESLAAILPEPPKAAPTFRRV